MALRKFLFLHGSVLAQIARKDRPVALTLIETTDDSWSAYKLNDEALLYIKSSQTPKSLTRTSSYKWQFTFSESHIREIKNFTKQYPLYLALVCAGKSLDDKAREVCLLEPNQILKCINLDSEMQQWITVEVIPGSSLRAYGALNARERDKLKISRNKLEEWEIPGA